MVATLSAPPHSAAAVAFDRAARLRHRRLVHWFQLGILVRLVQRLRVPQFPASLCTVAITVGITVAIIIASPIANTVANAIATSTINSAATTDSVVTIDSAIIVFTISSTTANAVTSRSLDTLQFG